MRRWHPTVHGKALVCVQSKVPGRAVSVPHIQWAIYLWEKCVSTVSSRSEDIVLQAPLLLPASKVTLNLREAQAKPPARWGFDGTMKP